jgi:hypothetical protein
MLLCHSIIQGLLSIVVVLPVGGENRLTAPRGGWVQEIVVGDQRVIKVLAGASEPYAKGVSTGLCPVVVTGSDGARKLMLLRVVKR